MGAKFTFTIPGTTTTYTRVTDNNGVIFLEDLDVTSIVIQEIEPAPGYIANDTPMTVQLVPNERVDVVFENTSQPGAAPDQDRPGRQSGGGRCHQGKPRGRRRSRRIYPLMKPVSSISAISRPEPTTCRKSRAPAVRHRQYGSQGNAGAGQNRGNHPAQPHQADAAYRQGGQRDQRPHRGRNL